MKDINALLVESYGGTQGIIVPGSGTYGMEAVARAFGTDKNVLVLRNGYFSFRWTQIFQACKIPKSEVVLKAIPIGEESEKNRQFTPFPLEQALEAINQQKPDVVFAPQVETASGMIIPEDYITKIGEAVHAYGGLFVIDAIAAGTIWLDMKKQNVDVVISAPQKGWSGPACCALVTLNQRALDVLEKSDGGASFACNLKSWNGVMKAYLDGGHKYYTTMPTDALEQVRDAMKETQKQGFDVIKKKQEELGLKVREMLSKHGLKSVAAKGFDAPGVVVVYSPDASIAKEFVNHGVQIAGGVPLMIDNGTNKQHDGFRTFRIGLFGLDKLNNIDKSVSDLESVLTSILAKNSL